MREAQQRVDSREFTEWLAEYRMDPWGDDRADLRIGILAAVVARLGGIKKAKPEDYVPKFGRNDNLIRKPDQVQAYFKAMVKRRGD